MRDFRPSNAARWMACPGSLRLVESLPDSLPERGSPAAAEGTRAHALAERLARVGVLGLPDGGTATPDDDEMLHTAEAWVQILRDAAAESEDSVVLLEQFVDSGVLGCSGTADAIVYGGRKLRVYDLKYGRGVPVEVEWNPQLLLYGCGAYDFMSDLFEVDSIELGIYQPRLHGVLQTWEIDIPTLEAWRAKATRAAQEAVNNPRSPFHPSEDACRFCPASGICRARAEHEVREDFGDPGEMTLTELGQALDRVTSLRRWCDDVSNAARDLIQGGKVIPGWELQAVKGRRRITDLDGLVEHLQSEGFQPEEVSKRTATIIQLQAALGDRFEELTRGFVEVSDDTYRLIEREDDF